MSEAQAAHIKKGLGAWLLEHCTVGLDEFLFPLLTSFWMFPVAFLLTLQFYLPGFGSGNARILGSCIIVFQCYYCEVFGATPKLANTFGFSYSCIYLFFNEAILHVFMSWFVSFVSHHWKENVELPLPQTDWMVKRNSMRDKMTDNYNFFLRKAERKELDEAWNVYMDFRKTLRRAFTVCFAQFGLFMYYLFELNGESKDDDSPGLDAHFKKNVSMIKFLFAVVLLMVAGDDEAGPAFSFQFWLDKMKKVVEHNQDYSFEEEKSAVFPHCGLFLKLCSLCCTNEDADFACSVPMSPSMHIYVRMFCDFFVNAFARAIICGTAPIMLCVEGPLDFVKDATAVFFILKLDDIENWVSLNEPDSWSPLSEDTSYEMRSIKDKGYRIEGLRKCLQFPTCDQIIELEKEKEKEKAEARASGYQPPRLSQFLEA